MMAGADDILLDAGGDTVEWVPEFVRQFDLTGVRPPWGSMRGGLVFPRYTLAYKGVEFAPMGGLHALSGQSGHGKTMTFTMLMTAVLSGEYGGIEWRGPSEPTVLYIDTEMEPENTQLVIARVRHMCGWAPAGDSDRLRWMSLRSEERMDKRWLYTLSAMEEMKPTVVFIDGLLDMIGDFNSNTEADAVVRRCMAMAQWHDCSLWCVAHQNFGQEKMTGHLGSILNRKVTDEFTTVRNKEGGVVSFTVEQRKGRGAPVPEMLFTVHPQDAGLERPLIVPSMCEADSEEDEARSVAALSVEEAMDAALGGGAALNTGELREAIKARLRIGTRKANEYIRKAEEQGIVEKEKAAGFGRPQTVYRLSNGEKIITKEEQGEVPF